MKTLLVSLVSDQTIPNVLFIKEFENFVDEYLFISTQGMEEKKTREWIINAVQLLDEKVLKPLIVDQFSFSDIENKLGLFNFDQYSKVIVNITGGTKIMSIATFEYFKTTEAEIYYYTGRDNELIKLSPGEKKEVITLNSEVSVAEYLEAYGFQIKEGHPSKISLEYTKYFFNRYTDTNFQFKSIIKQLREKRGKSVKKGQIEGLSEFLNDIKFPALDSNILNKREVKYLTGEWFEEYIYQSIRSEFGFNEEQIKTGLHLKRKNKKGVDVSNEFDVVFIYKNKLYTIECKTSVWVETKEYLSPIEPPKNFIKDVIYKSDSLQKGFGLYPKTSIYILDSIKGSSDSDGFKENMERANLYGIKVVGQEDLINKSFKKLLA